MENAEGHVLVVSYIMKSSKGREGRNFNPSVSETVNCILHKQGSCQAVFPNRSAVPILQAGFIKQACQQACSKLSLGKIWSHASYPTALTFL